jgi:iron-sulfur cluster repair protein YtfE (RIC family)
MAEETLAAALEREHHEIDAGIEKFAASAGEGAGDVDALAGALAALRRHIYLEEEFVFPSLRAAGMLGPILVMLREHGELWALMDQLEQDATPAVCEQLSARLDAHNSKEEPIVYPQMDAVLSEPAALELRRFLDSGSMPEGWVAAQARS